jgi:hypothetical protein
MIERNVFAVPVLSGSALVWSATISGVTVRLIILRTKCLLGSSLLDGGDSFQR